MRPLQGRKPNRSRSVTQGGAARRLALGSVLQRLRRVRLHTAVHFGAGGSITLFDRERWDCQRLQPRHRSWCGNRRQNEPEVRAVGEVGCPGDVAGSRLGRSCHGVVPADLEQLIKRHLKKPIREQAAEKGIGAAVITHRTAVREQVTAVAAAPLQQIR